jgi:tryptophan aminotransferase
MRTQERTWSLVQNLTHTSGVIPMFETLRCEMIGKFSVKRHPIYAKSEVTEVETDAEGINSLSLREVLESWPTSKPKPKILYTIPVRCCY